MTRALPKSCQVILALAMTAAACGTAKPVQPAGDHRVATQVLKMRWVKLLTPKMPNFHVPAMVEEYDRFEPIETSSAAFDTDKKRVFIGASVGGLYCLDVKTGRTVWRFGVDDPVGSTPLYDPEHKYVYFGADDGQFYALHARSGRLIWSTDTHSEVRRKIHQHQGTLYAGNANSTVFALDPSTGEVIWQYRRAAIEGFASAGYGDITLYESAILVGFGDGTVVSIDAINGTENWVHDLASEVSPSSSDGIVELVDADATPVVVNRSVVAASVAGGVHAMDVDSGKLLWTRPDLKGVTGLAAANGTVYAARSGGGLMALNPQDGEIVWTSQFETGVLQDPVVYNDVLIVTDSEYGLHVVSLGSGEIIQQVNQYQGFFARPSIHAGYLLILGNRGTLFAMAIL